ncbi:MAG: hypothetical protein U0P81_02770 [Holophagaceae bacterium]
MPRLRPLMTALPLLLVGSASSASEQNPIETLLASIAGNRKALAEAAQKSDTAKGIQALKTTLPKSAKQGADSAREFLGILRQAKAEGKLKELPAKPLQEIPSELKQFKDDIERYLKTKDLGELPAADKAAVTASLVQMKTDLSAASNLLGQLVPDDFDPGAEYLSAYLVTGRAEIGRSKEAGGQRASSGGMLEWVIPVTNPASSVLPNRLLPYVKLAVLHEDPQIVESTPDPATGTTTTTTTRSATTAFDLGARIFPQSWRHSFGETRTWGLGLDLSVGRRIYDRDQTIEIKPSSGTPTTTKSNGQIQDTVYKTALRFELLNSKDSQAGSFFELGYLHDPSYVAKADRYYFVNRWTTQGAGPAQVLIEFKYITGKGSRDDFTVLIGTRVKLGAVMNALLE